MKLIPLFVLILTINLIVDSIMSDDIPTPDTPNAQQSTANTDCPCQLECDTLAAECLCKKQKYLLVY